MIAVEQLMPLAGIVLACAALAISRASMHRRLRPVISCRKPRPSPARALSEKEREHVLDILRSPRFVDQAPTEVVYTLMDEGEYLCSVRGMYRILSANAEVRERRDQLRHPSYARPELLATAPNQVWSWDITALRGPEGHFYLYVVIDIFSRKTVGWLLARRQSGALAKRLIRETCRREGVEPAQLTIHSDRGTQMKSKTLAQLYADLDITASFSRPQVSDDNPFSEAQFKTLKYCAEFPDRFDSMNHARDFCRSFFDWYNEDHRHSGLRYLTPNQVHSGVSGSIVTARQRVLDAAHAQHPERFVRRPPKALAPPAVVYINPPKEEDKAASPPNLTEVTEDMAQLEAHPTLVDAAQPRLDVMIPRTASPSTPLAARDHPVGARGRPGRPRPGKAGGPTAGLERPAPQAQDGLPPKAEVVP
jgi:putative transposase